MNNLGLLSSGRSFFPPLSYKRTVITSNQWLNLLASPVVVLPAISGSLIVIESYNMIVKQSGTAYNNGAVTDLRGIAGIAGNFWMQVPVANLAGFTDVTTQSILLERQSRSFSPFIAAATPQTDLTLTTTGGEFATGTGDFIVYLSYRIWPRANLAWF